MFISHTETHRHTRTHTFVHGSRRETETNPQSDISLLLHIVDYTEINNVQLAPLTLPRNPLSIILGSEYPTLNN